MSVKYMGSKRVMLTNGFGEMIIEQATHADRIVDLFAGSGAVAWFAAQATDRPVHAYDLQQFSAVLSRAVVGRTKRIDVEGLTKRWLEPTRKALRRSSVLKSLRSERVTVAGVYAARRQASEQTGP